MGNALLWKTALEVRDHWHHASIDTSTMKISSQKIVSPLRPIPPQSIVKRAGIRLARYWKAIEARTLSALRARITSSAAAGWVRDGEPVKVTGYSGRRRRAVSRFSQSMFITPLHLGG
jgi:hypothetical protein